MTITQSILDFATGLSLDHISEASFLYEQRLSLLDDPELTWQDLDDFEQRFEPHIDGLVVGENLALEVCKQQASEGDFGELHAAMRVFCRQNRLDLALETIEAIDFEDAEKLQAVADALNDELPQAWQKDFIGLLQDGNQKLATILPKLIGHRRIAAGAELLQALHRNGTDSTFTLIWALGRLREQQARAPLLNIYRQHEDETGRAVAALALLRLGESQMINDLFNFVHMQNWPLIPLGLGGGRSAVPVLCDLASSVQPGADGLIALGLLGDISAVDILLTQLANTKLTEGAAHALNLITGAELYEEVFIPEAIDEDELFDEELEKLKRGEPLYPPGQEPGVKLTRLSQKPEDWQKWWAQNKSLFNSQIRYRNGKPYSPTCLLENLDSEKSPRQIRQLAYEELVIRYGVDFPFETDMFVAQQKQALAKYAEWIKTNGSRFREGRWYFAGQVMES